MARKTVSEEKQNLIRKRHLQGHTIKDIAVEVGLSEKTVSKYIKNAPAPPKVSGSSEDITLQLDYTTVLTKREELLTKKISAEVALYEDDIEGWSYHLTAHDDRIRQQGLWWSFIIYEDSVPDNYLDKLKATGMQIALSPWHDKDTWNHDSPEMVNAETGEIVPKGARYKMGDRKKSHRHGIVKTDKKVSWREMNALLQRILHCPYIQKCRSLKNAFDYFLHINDPNKYQGYFKDEIIKLNGFVIEPTKLEQGILYDEVATNVIEKKFSLWRDVVQHYHGQPEYMLIMSSRPSIITQLVKENFNEQHPEGRVQRVSIENGEIEYIKAVCEFITGESFENSKAKYDEWLERNGKQPQFKQARKKKGKV